YVCVNGLCSVGLQAGDPCDPQAQLCEPGIGLVCSFGMPHVCGNFTTPVSSVCCDMSGNPEVWCVNTHYCHHGLCVPDLTDGSACVEADNGQPNAPHCQAPANCVQSKCTYESLNCP